MSELIDCGTHLQTTDGQVMAKHSSNGFTKPKRKARKHRPAADWDIVFMAYGDVVRGRLTLPQLCKLVKIHEGTVRKHVKDGKWEERWRKTLEIQGEAEVLQPIKTVEQIARLQGQHPGGSAWIENLHKMLHKSGRKLSRMKPEEVLENSGKIKDLNTVARQNYGLDVKDEDQGATARPAINIQFLMQHG